MKTAILNIFLTFLFLSGCSVLRVNERLNALENSGGTTVREHLAEQQAMIDDLQQQIQTLRGKLQETDNLLKQKTRELEEADEKTDSRLTRWNDTATSNKERIDHLEQYLNVQSAEKKDGFFSRSDEAPDKETTENELYTAAKKQYERGDLQGARTAFKDFLDKYPESDQADNAIFWIAETYFHEKWYEKAILEYQKAIDQYPKGNKVPAALLKQGISFSLHGDNESAQLIMKELMDKFPDSSESKIAAKKLKEFEKQAAEQ